MARDRTAERFESLASRVLAPVVLGGPVTPLRPFGVRVGLTIGVGRSLADVDLRARIDVARVRVARLIAPVDTLPELDPPEWALAAALNDLLQLTNHELAGALLRGRYRRLLGSVVSLCANVSAPRTLRAALARHATFARVLELARTDTNVSWWTGRASFRGQPPPARLLKWRSLRSVEVDARRVALTDMIDGIPNVSPLEYAGALTLWLTRTPLTDLATATRRSPPFAWSASTLSLVSTAPGRALAYRALLRQPPDLAVVVLARAAKEVPDRFEAAKALAESFASEVAAGIKLLGERAGAA